MLRWRWGLCWLALLASCAALASPWPTRGWPRASPESQGVDSAALAALYEAVAEPRLRVDSVLIVRHGHIVSEAYFAPYEAGLLHDLRSAAKSVLGCLVGVALQRGQLLSVDQTLEPYFPEHFQAGRGADPRQRAITLGHLLEMRAGIEWREWPYDERSDVLRMAASGDAVRYILQQPMRDVPGERFHYSGAAPQLLAAVLLRATGVDAAAYARRELFEPLGITTSRWRTDSQGRAIGESGLSLQPRDLAKIGLLVLRDGIWDGRRLLPAGWVPMVGTRARTHGLPERLGLPPRYAGLWWIDERVPMAVASGRHGQYLVVLPRHDALVVVTAKTSDSEAEPLRLSDFVVQRVLPALRGDRALPENRAAQRRLEATLARLTAERALAGVRMPDAARRFMGQSYAIDPNPLGWTRISIAADTNAQGRLVLRWQPGSATGLPGQLELPLSFEGRFQRSTPTAQDVYASRAVWKDDKTLVVELQDLQGAVETELRLRFIDQALELSVTNGDGLQVMVKGRRD